MESCNCFQPISRLHISGKCMASFFFGVICWTHRNPFFIHPQWMEGEICFPRKFVDVLTLDDIIVARLHMNGCFTDSLMHFIFIAVVTWIECTISVGMLVVLARLHIEWSSCHLFLQYWYRVLMFIFNAHAVCEVWPNSTAGKCYHDHQHHNCCSFQYSGMLIRFKTMLLCYTGRCFIILVIFFNYTTHRYPPRRCFLTRRMCVIYLWAFSYIMLPS